MSRKQYNPKQIYVGEGDLSDYTFTFKITKAEQLLVIVVDDSGTEIERARGNSSGFISSLDFDPVKGGGTLHLSEELPIGYQLILLLADDEPTQDFEFRNKTDTSMRRFEAALDALAGAIQRLTYRAKQSFRLHDLDNEEEFDAQLPPRIADQKSRVFRVNSEGTGLEFGPTTDEIASAQDYAQQAKDAALQSEESAEDSEESAEIAEAAANEAQFLLFNGSLSLNHTNSPVELNGSTYVDKIIMISAEDGDVVINLDPIASYADNFKCQFIRTDDSVNTVTIVPNGSETIDNQVTYLLDKGLTVILSVDTETNWKKKFLGLVNGGSSLPLGGAAGDYLENNGTDPVWTSGQFSGFSARFNQQLDATDIRDMLLKIANYTYLGPQVSLSASGSGTVREKGVAVTSSNLTANVTKRTEAIKRVQFFLGATSINDLNPPSNTGSGSHTYSWSGSFTDNSTFKVEVTDMLDTVVSSSVNFTFVYPYFSGCRAPAANASQISALTKDVRTSTASLGKSFTAANGDVFYFAYPKSYGILTSIKDINNFESISSWTRRELTLTGNDSNSVDYYVYEYNTPQSANTTSFTFIR